MKKDSFHIRQYLYFFLYTITIFITFQWLMKCRVKTRHDRGKCSHY